MPTDLDHMRKWAEIMEWPRLDTILDRCERAEQDTRKLRDMLELAWGLIANAGGGDWHREGPDWKAAAVRWRDEHYHPSLDAAMKAQTPEPADPEETP